MSGEYTPITEAVRNTYANDRVDWEDQEGNDLDIFDAYGEFDRWLAEVKRAAAEAAYERGRLDERHDCNIVTAYEATEPRDPNWLRASLRSKNPYRKEQDSE